jgi:hypothetical protein
MRKSHMHGRRLVLGKGPGGGGRWGGGALCPESLSWLQPQISRGCQSGDNLKTGVHLLPLLLSKGYEDAYDTSKRFALGAW